MLKLLLVFALSSLALGLPVYFETPENYDGIVQLPVVAYGDSRWAEVQDTGMGLNLERRRRSPEWGVQGVWYPDNSGVVTAHGKEIPIVQSKDGAHTLHGGGHYTTTFNTPVRHSDWGANVGYTWRF